MKFAFLSFAMVLATSVTASAQTSLSPSETARLMGQAVEQTTDQQTKDLLGAALFGQTYEFRVSIIDSKCKFVGRSMVIACTVIIGTDSMVDDDNGWGTMYKLSIDGVQDGVVSTKLEVIAG